MDPEAPKSVEIVEQHGSFLLIRAGSAFAVLERRNGLLYPMSPGNREGLAVTREAMAVLLAEEGALPEEPARRLFDELCDRGERLAQSLR